MQFEEVFQEPDTGHAMDGRQMPTNFGLRCIGIIEQFFADNRIVEEDPFSRAGIGSDADTGGGVQFVEPGKAVFGQQTIYRLATEATEDGIVTGERGIGTGQAAMGAGGQTGDPGFGASWRGLIGNG